MPAGPPESDGVALQTAQWKFNDIAFRNFLSDKESEIEQLQQDCQANSESVSVHDTRSLTSGSVHQSWFDFDDLDKCQTVEDELLMHAVVKYFRQRENIRNWTAAVAHKFGDNVADLCQQAHLEFWQSVPMASCTLERGDSLDNQSMKSRKPLYSVCLLLDAAPDAVGSALARTLLEQPCQVDDVMHLGFFTEPEQGLAAEWAKFGEKAELIPEASRRAWWVKRRKAMMNTGLKPLHRHDFIEPLSHLPDGCKGFFLAFRFGDATDSSWSEPEHEIGDGLPFTTSRTYVQEDAPSDSSMSAVAPVERMFNIRVVFPMLTKQQQLQDLHLRCTVHAVQQPSGPLRTVFRREILLPEGLSRDEPLKFSALNDADDLVFSLEEEGRQWAKAQGFEVVEAWRGLRVPSEDLYAQSRILSSMHCLCSGEGAFSDSERRAGPLFDVEYAQRLAGRFSHANEASQIRAYDSLQNSQFVQGSICIDGFAYTLDRICRRAPAQADVFRSFVDLGAGCGLAVIAAHALFPFRSCRGIELVPEIWRSSRDRAKEYMESPDFEHSRGPKALMTPKTLLTLGDIFTVDWSDASVVLCNAVTWPPDTILNLFKMALKLRPGSLLILIALSKKMPLKHDLLCAFDYRTDASTVSWVSDRPVPFWVYQRI